MASPASGLSYFRKVLFLSLVALYPLSLAQGQEAPKAPSPSAPSEPQGGPSQPLPQPAPGAPTPAAPAGPQGGPSQPLPQPEPGAPTPAAPAGPQGGRVQPPSELLPAAPEGGISTTTQGLPEWLSTPPFREFTPLEGVLPPPVGSLEPPLVLRLGPPDQLETPPDFRLQAFLTVDEEYTDNVFQTKNNRQSAFQTNVTPGLSFIHERPNTTLNFMYAPTFFFSSNSQQSDQVNQYLTLRGALRPTAHLQFNIADDYTQSNSSLFNPNLGTAYTGTGNYTINTGSASGAYIGSLFRTALTYMNNYTTNANQSFNNSMTQTGLLSAGYTNLRTTIDGSYALVRGEYPNATLATLSPNYWEQDVKASFAHPLTQGISLTGSGLFTWHKTAQSLFQRNNFIIGGAQIGGNFSVGPTGLLAAQVGAQVYDPENQSTKVYPAAIISYTQQFSYFAVGASYQQAFTTNFTDVVATGPSETRTALLFLQTTAFRDVTARLSGQWDWNHYQQATQFGLAGTTVNTWQMKAQIRYAILRSLNLTLAYILTDRRSNVSNNEYLENRGTIAINYAYNFW